MKYTNVSLTALIASSLIGCVPVDEDAEVDQYVRAEAAKLATERQELDKKELQIALAEAKAKDPKVVDVYYTVDGNGERQLNIVRQSDNPSSDGSNGLETFTYAMMGMGAAMMMSNMMASSMYHDSNSYNRRATSVYRGNPRDTEERKRSGFAGYVASSNARITNNVYSRASNGGFRGSNGNSVSSSKGAFGSSGARGGAVGG